MGQELGFAAVVECCGLTLQKEGDHMAPDKLTSGSTKNRLVMQYKDYLKDFIGKQGRMTRDLGLYTVDLQSSVIDAEIVGVEDDFIILRQFGYNAQGKETFINHAIPLSAFRLIETVIEE